MIYIYIHIIQKHTYIWVNYNELTTSEPWKSSLGFGKSSPFMAARFRLVNYYNLPRYLPSGYLTGKPSISGPCSMANCEFFPDGRMNMVSLW